MENDKLSNDLAIYDKVYDDVRDIIGDKGFTDEVLGGLNEYAKKFIGEKNRGLQRTILINLKPLKNNPILKETLEIVANELRAGSTNGFI